MADQKLTVKPVATSTGTGDKYYVVQGGVSKQIDFDDMGLGATLQSIINNGNHAESPDGNTYIDIDLSDSGNGFFMFESFDGGSNFGIIEVTSSGVAFGGDSLGRIGLDNNTLHLSNLGGFQVDIKSDNVTTTRTKQFTDASGNVGIINTVAPSSASDTGAVGEIRVTATFIYTCIATDTWVRAVAATW